MRIRSVISFWLPLAATWLMMSLEGPYVAAFVARMPAAAHNLAGFGVATSLAWLIESPIIMLLSASTALVHGRESFLALRRFAFWLNALVTIGMTLLVIPPVFRFVGGDLIGLPAEITQIAHAAMTVMILWPAAIGYRRFYQGILVRHHLTRRVAYGTVVRLVTMSVTAFAAYRTSMPGAMLGAVSLVAGVIAEAAASRWMAHGTVKTLLAQDEVSEASLLSMRAIAQFYYPLALTSMLGMALGPLVTFALSRGRDPIESLAVWPIVVTTVFIFRSGGIAYQEVGIALANRGEQAARNVRRTAELLGVAFTLALALIAFTPLETIWLQRVTGLPERLATFAIWPIRVLVLLPLLDFLLSVQRSRWIVARRTSVVTMATVIEGSGLALALVALIGWWNLAGAVAGALAMLTGRIAANGYLHWRGRSETALVA
jgi:hypothetical protein